MSCTSRTAGNKDGHNHDKVSQYLAVDCVVFEKELVVSDSDSGRPGSTSESGRPEVPVQKILDDEPPPRRHLSSCRETRIVEDCGRRQSIGSALESRRSNHAPKASTTASLKSSYEDLTLQ